MNKVFRNISGLLFCAFLLPEITYAETKRKKPVFQSRKNLRKVDINLPESLSFKPRNVARESNMRVAQEFFSLGALISDERYVSRNYLGVFVVHLTIAEPMDKKEAEALVSKKEIAGHQILEKGVFSFGNNGLWWKTRQKFPSISYIKYISIFSNTFQTDIVAAIYEERFEKSFIPSLMKSIISTSKISDRPF